MKSLTPLEEVNALIVMLSLVLLKKGLVTRRELDEAKRVAFETQREAA